MTNTPRLRFNQFSGDWSPRLLSNFATKITQKNGDYKVTNVISNSAKNGLISQKDYFDKDIANQDNINGYYVINDGDFVYNPRKSNESPYGPINRFSSTEAGVVSPLYLCFSVNHEVNDRYLEYYFKSSKWYQFIYRNSDQGARHDRVSIRDVEFFKMKLNIPNYQEQEKIASFFSLIDKKIELQTEKVEELKKYKKGIMQKIFSQELIFKDENGNEYPEWNQLSIGELAEVTTGRKKDADRGEYIIMDMGSVTFEGKILTHKRSSNGIDLLKKGDLVMPKDDIGGGLIIGKTAYIPADNKYILGDHVYRIRFKNNNSLFMHYQINSNEVNKQIKRKVTGSAQLGINSKSVVEQILFVPNIEEQNKIGILLLSLDSKIEVEEEKLNVLEEYKKGFLQQMFI